MLANVARAKVPQRCQISKLKQEIRDVLSNKYQTGSAESSAETFWYYLGDEKPRYPLFKLFLCVYLIPGCRASNISHEGPSLQYLKIFTQF